MITIITVNFNNYNGLVKTVNSFLNQASENNSLLIVDGGSTDGSVEYLASLKPSERLRWLSEADGGIYEAMNKGVTLSQTKFVAFINSGDELYDRNTLQRVESEIDKKPNYGIYIFGTYNCRLGTIQRKRFFRPLRRVGVCHQRVIYNLEVKKLLYDVSYEYAADFKSILSVMCDSSIKNNALYSKIILSSYEGGGTSFKHKNAVARERSEISKKFRFTGWRKLCLV
jgi:glycosyltransferase involved in cell wall biosynthesis